MEALRRNFPGRPWEIEIKFLSHIACVKAEIRTGNLHNKGSKPDRYIFVLGKALLKHLWGTTKASTSVCEPMTRGVTKTRCSANHDVVQFNLTFIFHRLERTGYSLYVTHSSMNWCYRTGMVWRMNKLNPVSVSSCYDRQETVKKNFLAQLVHP